MTTEIQQLKNQIENLTRLRDIARDFHRKRTTAALFRLSDKESLEKKAEAFRSLNKITNDIEELKERLYMLEEWK